MHEARLIIQSYRAKNSHSAEQLKYITAVERVLEMLEKLQAAGQGLTMSTVEDRSVGRAAVVGSPMISQPLLHH